MLISKIIGGLGNQMFQYATGFALAKKYNLVYKLDTTSFTSYKLHTYHLEDLNITCKEKITDKDLGKYQKIWNLRTKLPISVQPMLYLSIPYVYKEQKFSYNHNLIADRDKSLYLDGYFQSEKYFVEYREDILKEFRIVHKPLIKNTKLLESIKSSNSVSLHIRRGDYVRNKQTLSFHGNMPLGYYKKALSYIHKREKNTNLYVFSDDPDWCERNLKLGVKFYIVRNDADHNYEDLRLMMNCKHNIIANSSFSWWGAWLNQSPDKIVIAPKQWFSDPSVDTSDVIPKQWQKI